MNVPKDLRPYVAKKELRYSLRTGYLGVAKLKARYLASQVQILFLHLRRNIPVMSKLSQDQIPELVRQYIKDRFEYLKGMYTDKRYLKEKDSYHYDGDDPDSIENVGDNMASLKYQMAHYCQLYLTTGDAESEMLADNIMELLQQNDVDQIDKGSPKYKELSAEIHDAETQILPLEADRLTGGHSYKQEMPKLFKFLRGNRNEQPESEDTGILFSKLIDMYAEEHKEMKSIKKYVQGYQYFIQVMGDMHIKTIKRSTIKEFVEKARRLPININSFKRYRDKTVDEILEMDIPEKEIISPNTIDKHTRRLSSLFNDARRMFNVYDDDNPVYRVKIGEQDDEDSREPFTKEELSRLFSKDNYQSMKKSFQFWCPLIALFHGMRRREIAQLYLEDIKYTDDDVWIFDINRNTPDKSLKTKSAKRIVPIHPFFLNELKFITYVENLRSKGEARLFPELRDSGIDEGYGKQVGAWFNENYKKQCGIDLSDGKLRDLHSFRHNWTTLLMGKGVDWFARLKTVGHKGKVDTESDGYFHGHVAKYLLENIISKVDWEKQLDLSHLKKSKFVVR